MREIVTEYAIEENEIEEDEIIGDLFSAEGSFNYDYLLENNAKHITYKIYEHNKDKQVYYAESNKSLGSGPCCFVIAYNVVFQE